MPDAQQAKLVSNIVGQMTGMFLHHPDRIDGWLETIRHPRLEAFAVVALGLAGRREAALSFSQARDIETVRVASVMTYNFGERFATDPKPFGDRSIESWLEGHGTVQTMPHQAPWRQDLLWSLAFVEEDGARLRPILERMDRFFDELQLRPGNAVMRERFEAGEFTDRLLSVKEKQGGKAYLTVLLQHLYLVSGSWSFASNHRLAYVAETFADYAKNNPNSSAVEEIRLAIANGEQSSAK